MDIKKLKGNLPDVIFNQLQSVIDKFQINTKERMAHFLGQSSHESANFKVFIENLNYSSDALLRVFPKYFTAQTAAQYQHNQEAIGSKIYANRMGNGDEKSKDGYKFRGRGAIQLTGHDNYKAFGLAIGIDLLTNPDLVATDYALLSASWFFSKNGLNTIADKGMNDTVITEITKRINGGVIGLDSRKQLTNQFYSLLA